MTTMMPSSRSLLSSRSSSRSVAARAFAPSKPKEGALLEKTSAAANMPAKTKSGTAPKTPASISLQTHFVADFGDELKVVTAPSWSLDSAVAMKWGEDNLWSAQLEPEEEEALEFKLVLAKADGSVAWEEGPNRVISAASSSAPLLSLSWGVAEALEIPAVEGEGERATAAPGASEASPAPEPAAVVAPSSSGAESVLEAMGQFVKSFSSLSEEEAEEKVEEEEVEAEAAAPVAAAALAAAEIEPEAAKAPSSNNSVQNAAAAAALGVGGALLATALAVDLADAALLGAAAAAVAAATGSNSSNNPAAAAASRAARAALEAPERLLRAAGMKSFVEREAEAAAAASAAAEAAKEEETEEEDEE